MSDFTAAPTVDGRRNPPLIINGTLYLRIFAAASVVWFHTSGVPIRSVGEIGLAIFVYLSFIHVGYVRNPRAMIARQARRLLLPWACWWVLYAASQFWLARGVPVEVTSPESIWTLLAWPSIHLWFLPFLFVAHVVVMAIGTTTVSVSAPVKSAVALAVGLLLLECLAFTPHLPPFAAQVWHAMPAIGVGLAYGYCLTLSRPRRLPVFVAIAVLVALAAVPIWLFGDRALIVPAVGSTTLMVLVTISVPRSRLVMRLARLTLGVYLSHPAVILVLKKLLGADVPFWVAAPTTWIVATALAWAMTRNRFLRVAV